MITSSKPQKSVTIASLAALAAMIGVTAGLACNLPASDPAWRAPNQLSRTQFAPAIANDQRVEPRSAAGGRVGALEASKVVRCIMPRAWQRGCGESAVKIAAN